MSEIDQKEDKKHINVMICTPGFSLMGNYVKSLLATIGYLNDNGISWGYSNSYSSLVHDARETTLSGTKDNNLAETRPFQGSITYDKLFWIDSDISWTTEDFAKLYESDKDMVSGAYLIGTGQVMAYKELYGMPYSYQEIKNSRRLMEIEACGFGFLCVKQGVFESLSRPWFQSVPGNVDMGDGNIISMSITGEDVSLCKRATDAGFSIWLDPTVQVVHHKTMQLTWEGVKPHE